jgi:hypothetical protein
VQAAFFIVSKYAITKKVTTDVAAKAMDAPYLIHSNPAILLATIVHMLCNPANVPIAVAVSFGDEILEIHPLAMPSVAAA